MRSLFVLLVMAVWALSRAPTGSIRVLVGRLLRRSPLGALWFRRREEAQLVTELPGALERLSAGLRSGGSFLGGITGWAGATGPLGADARALVGRVEEGATLGTALAAWAGERDLAEVGVAAGALRIGAEVGGRSAVGLDGLAAALRDAAETRSEVVAQSAQARLSALVIGVAPAGSVAVSALLDPRVPAVLVGTGPGRACLAGGLGMMGAAGLWMTRILRVPA